MAANVNKPTDIKQKEADINRKLQIYGIVSAFQNGKVPSNDQIDVALNSFLDSRALSNPSDKVSPEGKVLVEDTREVVKAAKYLLLSKNEGNLIQDFIWQTTHFDTKSLSAPNAPVGKDAARKDGDEALGGLRTLGTLLITNGQFRKLLSDATILLRDMAGDAATNAATRVRPSEEQMAQMDRPADDNTWHDKPDFSKESMRKQTQGLYGGNAKKDAQDVAAVGVDAARPETGNGQIDPTTGVRAAKDAAKERLDTNTDEESKQNMLHRNEEYRRRAREYFNKKMPQERKDQTIWRLKKMILECQQHPDYSQAIQTLLRLAETYGKHGRTIGGDSAGSAKDVRGELATAEADLRTLVERFANGTSTEDLWDSIGQIYRDADKDDELKNWFKDMDNYVRRCLLEQGYILEDASTQEWDQLYEQGRYLLRDKYRRHTDHVIDEVKFLVDQFDKDPQNRAFANALQKLFHDLGNDENGKAVFKPHLIKDLTEVIIPAIMENTSYIPVPRIEYTDPKFDAIIENLVLESDNFMPNVMDVNSEHHFRWGRKKIVNKNHQTIDIKIAGIQMDLRDVSYHIKRKQGFPSITDTGVMDILLPGEGFSFKMKVSTADKKDSQNYFKVDKVDVDFKRLKIKLKQSKYKLLFNLFKPLMLKVLRPPLQKAVEKAIKDQCNQLDGLVYQIKQEADRAKDEAKRDPQHASNIYQRYYNAAHKRMLRGKKKAEGVAKDKKVNVAMTQEDSIFPNIHLPGGISSKATEYKELARKGEKWESPVFSIGSAKKSTDVPSAPKIERKPHEVSSTRGKPHGNGGANYGNGGVSHGNGNGHFNSMAPPLAGVNENGYRKTGNGNMPATGGVPGTSNVQGDTGVPTQHFNTVTSL